MEFSERKERGGEMCVTVLIDENRYFVIGKLENFTNFTPKTRKLINDRR